MSLATWGAEPDEGGVILPLADYLDLDRTSAHYIEQFINGRGALEPVWDPGSLRSAESPGDAVKIVLTKPAWDPGIQIGWSSAGRWSLRLHGHEGEKSGTCMLGYSEPPGLRDST